MPFAIGSSSTSLQLNRGLAGRAGALGQSFERLSSGKRINRASDDAASLAIALSQSANARTGSVALRNINDGISASSIAEGGLSSATDITTRLSELATQSANGTLSDAQRGALNQEYQALREELGRISQTTQFNGVQLLSGDGQISIQAGISGGSEGQLALQLPNVNAESLGLSADISTAAGARAALDQTQAARESLVQTRGELGATSARFEEAIAGLRVAVEGNQAAASQLLDANIAQEAANAIAASIGLESGAALAGQANVSAEAALQLL